MDTERVVVSIVTSRKETSTMASGSPMLDMVLERWSTTTLVSIMVTGRMVSATEKVFLPIKKPVMFILAGGASVRRRVTAHMFLRKQA